MLPAAEFVDWLPRRFRVYNEAGCMDDHILAVLWAPVGLFCGCARACNHVRIWCMYAWSTIRRTVKRQLPQPPRRKVQGTPLSNNLLSSACDRCCYHAPVTAVGTNA